MSLYRKIDDTRSMCPKCGGTCWLLTAKDARWRVPAFYVCKGGPKMGGCGYIGEIGVGEVERADFGEATIERKEAGT